MGKIFTVLLIVILSVFNGGLSFSMDHGDVDCLNACSTEDVSCGHSDAEHRDPFSGLHAHDCVHTNCQHAAMIFPRWDTDSSLALCETRLPFVLEKEVSDQSLAFGIEEPPKA